MSRELEPDDLIFHATVEGLNGRTARGTRRMEVFRGLREDDPLLLVLDDRDGKGRTSRVLVYTVDGEDVGHVESDLSSGAARALKSLAVFEVTVLDVSPFNGQEKLVIDAVAIASTESGTPRAERKKAERILQKYASIDHPWAKWRAKAPLPKRAQSGGLCGCIILLAAGIAIAAYFLLR